MVRLDTSTYKIEKKSGVALYTVFLYIYRNLIEWLLPVYKQGFINDCWDRYDYPGGVRTDLFTWLYVGVSCGECVVGK